MGFNIKVLLKMRSYLFKPPVRLLLEYLYVFERKEVILEFKNILAYHLEFVNKKTS